MAGGIPAIVDMGDVRPPAMGHVLGRRVEYGQAQVAQREQREGQQA